MAEFLPLPYPVDHDKMLRLAEALTMIMEQGRDPGPRGVQTRSLGRSIDLLVQTLQGQLKELGVAKELGALTDRLKQLAAFARLYQDDELISFP